MTNPKKGETVEGGPRGRWRGIVLGFTKLGVKVRWTTGPLKGREAMPDKATIRCAR